MCPIYRLMYFLPFVYLVYGYTGRRYDVRTTFTMPTVTNIADTGYAQYPDAQWQEIAQYVPLYMGKWENTISLSSQSGKGKPQYRDLGTRQYKKPDSAYVQLLLDTTRLITAHNIYVQKNDGYVKQNVKCYPVMLGNTSTDTLWVGYGSYMPFLQEALDKDGQWKPIQVPFYYSCGTGLHNIYLPPGEIAIVGVPVYQGNYRTRIRLRYHNTVSQEFNGSINSNQFINRFPDDQ